MKAVCLLLGSALMLAGCGGKKAASGDPLEALKQNRDAMYALKDYRAVCIQKSVYDDPKRAVEYRVAAFTAEKPNLMRYDEWSLPSVPEDLNSVLAKTPPYMTCTCDGHQCFNQVDTGYRANPYRSTIQLQTGMDNAWGGFFDRDASLYGEVMWRKQRGLKYDLSLEGTDNVEGVLCEKVKLHVADSFEDENNTYFIGVEDHLVHQVTGHSSFYGKGGTETTTVRNVVLNEAAKSDTFRYVAPLGVKFKPKSM